LRRRGATPRHERHQPAQQNDPPHFPPPPNSWFRTAPPPPPPDDRAEPEPEPCVARTDVALIDPPLPFDPCTTTFPPGCMAWTLVVIVLLTDSPTGTFTRTVPPCGVGT